jgi:hypothetical protein
LAETVKSFSRPWSRSDRRSIGNTIMPWYLDQGADQWSRVFRGGRPA